MAASRVESSNDSSARRSECLSDCSEISSPKMPIQLGKHDARTVKRSEIVALDIAHSPADSKENESEIEDDSLRILIDESKNNNCKVNTELLDEEKKGVSLLKRKQSSSDEEPPSPEVVKRRKENPSNDNYCWKCHKDFVEIFCSACPRSWHKKCMGATAQSLTTNNWICGECACILRAENAATRAPALAHFTVDQFCQVLKYVVERMRLSAGAQPFLRAVDLAEIPNYTDYVIYPMDLSLLLAKVNGKLYGSTDAFMADAKWIQHNCIVFNTSGGKYADTSKLTNVVKKIIKTARQEVSEIEACPDCYVRGRGIPRPNPSWFIEACRQPHALIWAKMNGFPYWPAKALPRINGQGYVDVRFFGEHDRAWISPKNIFLYSREPPTPLPRKKKRSEMTRCLNEIAQHCKRLEMVFGPFKFAPPRIQYRPFDPSQIQLMFPAYDPNHTYDPSNPADLVESVDSPRAASPAPSDTSTPAKLTTRTHERKSSDVEPEMDDDEEFEDEIDTPKPKSKSSKPGLSMASRRTLDSSSKSTTKLTSGVSILRKVPVKSNKIGSRTISNSTILSPATPSAMKLFKLKGHTLDGVKSMDRTSESELQDPEMVRKMPVRQSRAKKTFPNKPRLAPSFAKPSAVGSTSGAADYELLPPEAGPLSAHLNKGAQELVRQMARLIEESMKEAASARANGGSVEAHEATIYSLRLQIERMSWQHRQQLEEFKQTTDRTLREMRASLEVERLRAIEEIRKETDDERIRSVNEAKLKEWCIYCSREAMYYCCWNTAYCSLSCQQLHWVTHERKCLQKPKITTYDRISSTNETSKPPKLIAGTTVIHNVVNRAT